MAISSVDDDDIEIDDHLPPELQEEFDRLVAARAAKHPPRERLTPELEQLEADIGMARGLRELHGDDMPLYQLGRFEALSSVRGGMGLVIKARDPQLDRHVAIKLWLRSGPEWQAALLAEAKLLAKLEHPNVVRVYQPGLWQDGHVYFVMEWIEGVDGHDWLEQPRSWPQVLRVFIAAATGLAAAHEAGIQHRDFKPSNILIGNDGRVVIADFGVADSLCDSSERDGLANSWGNNPGTPAYMAPERLRGERGDARSDQFSFCATLWRGLYGQRPFAGERREQLLGEIERGELREDPRADVPLWLNEVVRKGLAVDPDERFRDMRELIAALQAEPVVEVAPSGDGAVPRERWPYLATGFLSALVLVMGFALVRSPEAKPVAGAAVEIDPYHAILGAVTDDDFAAAERLWLEHRSTLTDAQTLRIAHDCWKRASELLPVDRATAESAVLVADQIARDLMRYGDTPEAQAAGGQLVLETSAWWLDHPPSSAE
jgi:tRNA A-37 threonylcarbamoyl transferase component Bud32